MAVAGLEGYNKVPSVMQERIIKVALELLILSETATLPAEKVAIAASKLGAVSFKS